MTSIRVVFWLCMLWFVHCVTGQNHSIKQFAPQTMAYVEECNNVTEIVGYWSLAMHTNSDVYYRNVDQLHVTLKDLESHCGSRGKESVCAQVMSNFKERLRVITENERVIKNKTAVLEKRGIGLVLLGAAIGTASALVYNWIRDSSKTDGLRALLDKQKSVIELATLQIGGL